MFRAAVLHTHMQTHPGTLIHDTVVPRCCANMLRRRRLLSSSTEDPYRVLGVPRRCSNEELKQAFRQAAMRWHPDMQGNSNVAEAERMFKRISWAYETAVAQRSGRNPLHAGAANGSTQQSDTWYRHHQHQRQHRQRQHHWQHRQHQHQWQRRQDQGKRTRWEHNRAHAFIERIKGSVLASAVLLCVLFSGTPSTRDDIFSPIRRLLGTQREAKPASSVLEMDDAAKTSPRTQRRTLYPASWMADAVKEEEERYPKGIGSQPAHGAPMGAAGVALAKSAWLSRQSHEKYSTAVEDIVDAQRLAREGRPQRTPRLETRDTEASTSTHLEMRTVE